MDETRADIAELRQELHAVEHRLSEQITRELGEASKQLTREIGEVSKQHSARSDSLLEAIHVVDKRIDQKHAQLIAWSFVFWVGAVASIAALAGVLRR